MEGRCPRGRAEPVQEAAGRLAQRRSVGACTGCTSGGRTWGEVSERCSVVVVEGTDRGASAVASPLVI